MRGAFGLPLFFINITMSYLEETIRGSTADLPVNDTTPATNNYLSSNFFKFQLPRTRTLNYFATAVNLPALNLSPVEMPNRLGRPNQFVGGRYDLEPLTIQFLVNEDLKNYKEIFNWMTSIGLYENTSDIIAGAQVKEFFSDATLFLTNSAYVISQKVKFTNTYPIQLSGLQFSSQLNDNEPLQATVTLNFENYTFEDI
jgi:hypothetical protein